jgi:NTE family protein
MKYLVLGPGAIGVYAIFGLLKKMKDSGDFSDLLEVSASSAGAIAAFCIFANVSVDDALKIDAATTLSIRIKNLLRTSGLIDPSESLRILKQFSSKTFQEMYNDTKIKLHIAAFSIEKLSTVYMSVDTSPDLKVAEAVMASMSIPILFPPSNGYLDGSLMEEVPWTPFAGTSPDDLVAVRIVTKDWQPPESGLMRVLVVLLNVCWSLRAKYHGRTIDLDIGDINLVDFKTSHDSKLRMFLLGYSVS